MASDNYAESTIAGVSWKRIGVIRIDKPRPPLVPSILLVEDEVINIGAKEICTTVANLGCQFDQEDADDVMLYELLNKKYVKLREARDTPPIIEPEVTP